MLSARKDKNSSSNGNDNGNSDVDSDSDCSKARITRNGAERDTSATHNREIDDSDSLLPTTASGVERVSERACK